MSLYLAVVIGVVVAIALACSGSSSSAPGASPDQQATSTSTASSSPTPTDPSPPSQTPTSIPTEAPDPSPTPPSTPELAPLSTTTANDVGEVKADADAPAPKEQVFIPSKLSAQDQTARFPTLINPKFISAAEADIDADALVLGLSIDGESKAYPHRMMWFHHVANDMIAGRPVTVTY